MLTAIGSEQIAVEAMKLGLVDYLTKNSASMDLLPRAVKTRSRSSAWNGRSRFSGGRSNSAIAIWKRPTRFFFERKKSTGGLRRRFRSWSGQRRNAA